jgi:hypothetical protein
MATLQICPPAYDSSLEWPQAPHRPKHPVTVGYEAGEAISTGVDFSDYTRFQTRRGCDPTAGRRLDNPPWAFPGAAQRALLTRYIEQRADFRTPQLGTERERLERAQQRLLARRPKLLATLDRLMTALNAGPPYRGCNTDGRFISRRCLEAKVQGIDSELCIMKGNVAGTIARVIFLYYGSGMDSVGVGAETGLRPSAVRQLLHRLHRVWQRMEAEAQ